MKKITIIGLGMMGCSVASASKQNNPAITISGYDNNSLAGKQALARGNIDEYCDNIPNAIKQSELIIIAAPLHIMPQLFTGLGRYIDNHTIVTDIGSVKQNVINDALKHFSSHFSQFVPGHPMAGSEKSGGEFAQAELFNEKLILLTPHPKTSSAALHAVTTFWQQLNAKVVSLTAKAHDEIVAYTSHLPHALAMALMHTAIGQENKLNFTSGGFKSVARLAQANTEMWHSIFCFNREEILKQLRSYHHHLDELIDLLQMKNDKNLLKWLEKIPKG